jgi:hypothetical protein
VFDVVQCWCSKEPLPHTVGSILLWRLIVQVTLML